MEKYKKGDYVLVEYDGELLTSKILDIVGEKATVEVCLSSRRGEKLLTDTITVETSKLQDLGITKK